MSSQAGIPDLPNEEDASSEWDNVVKEVSGDDQDPDGKICVSNDSLSPMSSDEDWQSAVQQEMDARGKDPTNNVKTDVEGSQAIVPNSSAANEEDADSARSRAASPWEVANDPDATDNDIMTGDLLGFHDLPVETNPSTYNEEELEGNASKPSSTVNEQESHSRESRPTSPWEVEDIPDEKIISSHPMGDVVNSSKIEETGSGEGLTIKSEESDGGFVLTPVPSHDASIKRDETETQSTNLWDQLLEESNDVKSDILETVVDQESVPTEASQRKIINEIPSTNISSSEEEDEEGFILTKSRSEDLDQPIESSTVGNAQQNDLLKIKEDREKIAKAAKLAASFMLGAATSAELEEEESLPAVPVQEESKVITEPETEPSTIPEVNKLVTSDERTTEPSASVTKELESSAQSAIDSNSNSSESEYAEETREDLDDLKDSKEPLIKVESMTTKPIELNKESISAQGQDPDTLIAEYSETVDDSSPATTAEAIQSTSTSVDDKSSADGKLNTIKRENPFDDEKDEDLVILEPPVAGRKDDEPARNLNTFDPFVGFDNATTVTNETTILSRGSLTTVPTSQPGVQSNFMNNVGPAAAAFMASSSISQATPSLNLSEQKPPLSPKRQPSPRSFLQGSRKTPSPNKRESREIEMTSVPPKQSLLQKARNKADTDFDDCASYQRWEDDVPDDVSEISTGFVSHNPTVKSTAHSTRSEFTKYSLNQQQAAMEQARKLNKNRVRVVPLIFCGLFAIVTGVIGCMYAQFTCHFASAKAQGGDYQSNFYLRAGLWKYSPIESVFEGIKQCYSYSDDYGAGVEKFSRLCGILALFTGTFSVVVLWAFLVTVKTNELYWKLGVKCSLAAGFFQCGTFLLFKSEHCSKVGCSMGPGSFVSFLAVVTWFAMSYEMHHNSPISAQIKFIKPSSSTWWGSSLFPMSEKRKDTRHVPSLAEAFRRNQQSASHGDSLSYMPPHHDCPV